MTEVVDPREKTLELAAEIERRERQPDLCTIYRPHSDEMRQMAMWITAKEDAFVSLESSR
jgi:hypothetical protein